MTFTQSLSACRAYTAGLIVIALGVGWIPNQWNLLLWPASATTVAACHTSGLRRVNLSARWFPSVQATLVSWH